MIVGEYLQRNSLQGVMGVPAEVDDCVVLECLDCIVLMFSSRTTLNALLPFRVYPMGSPGNKEVLQHNIRSPSRSVVSLFEIPPLFLLNTLCSPCVVYPLLSKSSCPLDFCRSPYTATLGPFSCPLTQTSSHTTTTESKFFTSTPRKKAATAYGSTTDQGSGAQ